MEPVPVVALSAVPPIPVVPVALVPVPWLVWVVPVTLVPAVPPMLEELVEVPLAEEPPLVALCAKADPPSSKLRTIAKDFMAVPFVGERHNPPLGASFPVL